jgi:hypothetical protein
LEEKRKRERALEGKTVREVVEAAWAAWEARRARVRAILDAD